MRSTHRLPLLLSAGIAGLLLAALPVGFDGTTLSPAASQAWAGAENGHGNGHGNGNANGHDNHAENDSDDDADAHDLGALNAAHASETALAHASPNSRVGKIAAYKEAELKAQAAAEAATEADAVQTAGKDAFDAADLNHDGVLDDAEKAAMTPAQQAAVAAADVNGDGVIDDSDTADVQAAAEAAQADADAALVNASNKDITDDQGNVLTDVRDAVNHLLGID
jgi:EF hand domain-containing protein